MFQQHRLSDIMNVDYNLAIPMFVDESRVFIDAQPSSAIVIHKTAGMSTIEELGNWFATASSKVSTHYGVGLDGRVAQFVSENDGAGGNCCLEVGYDKFWDQFSGNKNNYTISIEHLDPALDNSTTPTSEQLSASFRLVLDICRRKGIDASRIKPHSSLEPESRRDCPGNYPLEELINYVRSSMSALPQALQEAGWSDDGTHLYPPNHKFPIVYGMRDFILDPNNGWRGDDFPITPETYVGTIEEFNPSLKGVPGSYQLFLYSRLVYNKLTNKVYKGYIGEELLWWMNKT